MLELIQIPILCNNNKKHIVTYLLKAGIAEPEETSVAKWLSEHFPMATKSRDRRNDYTIATKDELLEAVFSVGSVQTLRLLLHNRPLAEA
jgi:hypothetical protein